jgi:superfamily II DNA/RNA helicase
MNVPLYPSSSIKRAFHTFGLLPSLSQTLSALKLHVPTEIQRKVSVVMNWRTVAVCFTCDKKAIPEILAHKDAIINAETGSGKTFGQ